MDLKPPQKFLDIVRDLRPGKNFEHSGGSRLRFYWLGPAVFGLAGGLLGALVVFILGINFFTPANLFQPVIPVLEPKSSETVSQPKMGSQPLMERISAAAVAVYKKGAEGGEILSTENFLQSGVPLTSDGWVVTVKLNNLAAKDLGVVWGRKFYASEKIINDDFAGLTFLKIKAAGLPVLPFGQIAAARKGDDFLALDGKGNLFSRQLVNPRVYLSDGMVSSSEKLDVLAAIEGTPLGAPIFTAAGELMGLATADGKMIPADFIESGLASVLKDGKVLRPSLGARYLDLSLSVFNGEPKLGALLKTSKDGKAVTKGFPAEGAGLKEGDIVVSVDNFELNQNQTLAEALAGFTPGTKVVLTILREGKEVKVSVTL
ncbi:MAG: PDZ domain-containing protein [bacterium]|nr:PDZ domain-containing protein [bacterium]